jgi:DNA-directed RNA polymerase beta subunit
MMEFSKDEHFKNSWLIIDKYFGPNKGYQLTKHLIDSFNDFVLRKLDDIIEGFNPIEIQHHWLPEHETFANLMTIEIKNPIISKPTIFEKDGSTKPMTPNDARTRNFTYSAPLYVDMSITAKQFNPTTGEYIEESKKLNNVSIGKLPIMVHSKYCILSENPMCEGECRYDYGGYFIINGNEKVVISQDRIAENKTYVFVNNKVSAYSHVAEIRSVQENKFSVPKTTTLKLSSKPNQYGRYIRANIHHIKHDVPVFVLFKALGVETDEDIIKYIVYDVNLPDAKRIMTELIGSIEEANNVSCAREALEFLSRYMNINGYPREILNNKVKRIEILRNVLRHEFLPHVGVEYHKKALYLGYMINKLVRCYLGLQPFDDRDSYINKRVDTPGILMANLFRQYYGKVIKDMKNMIQKDINNGSWKATNKFINVINRVNINKVLKSTIIEGGLKYGLATGNWGIKSNKTKQGVAQVLNRMTYNATLSHLRRINTPIEKTGKLVQPRKLHSTQFGIICPAETPEGVSVGLVKNMSMICNISIAANSTSLREMLESTDIVLFDGENPHIFANKTKVIVNGDIIGVHEEPQNLITKLRFWKRKGIINVYTSIYWNVYRNEIWVCTEAGRCLRPVIIVDNNRLRLTRDNIDTLRSKNTTWMDLVTGTRGSEEDDAFVEYVDVEESNTLMIAMRYQDLFKGFKGSTYPVQYSHLELDPSLILGVLAGSIPFSDHNQSPRNCYQCLWLEEEVLMADGSRKQIKDVKVGDRVMTFDNSTMKTSYSNVIHQYVRTTEKTIYELTTVSGRRIKATSNHPLMTESGWKHVEDITQTDKIGVFMQHITNLSFSDCEKYDVLTAESCRRVLENLQVNPSLINKHIKQLEGGSILPLTSHDTRLAIIARIIGYLTTDGAINIYNKKHGGMTPQVQANFGSLDDADEFEADVEELGFVKTSPIFQDRVIHDVHHKTYKISHNGPLATLVVALYGAIGSRTKSDKVPIPQWIMNGSSLVKKEFLSGWQGGYGNKIYHNTTRKYGFQTLPVYHTIQPEYIDSLHAYMTQLGKLYQDTGVKIRFIKKMNRESYGKVKVGLYFEDSEANFSNIIENIGYKYCTDKTSTCAVILEYLKAKMSGYTAGYNDFKKCVTTMANTIFVPVAKKEVQENCLISDITVASHNHSFITTGGIMSSNSAMGKQAIGIYTSNFRHRYDTLGHVLSYPQRPFVTTRASKIVNIDELPCGANVIVAIGTYTGFNQEDSVIMNKSAVDRGMFVSTYYRTYKEQNNKNHSTGEEEYFCKPDPNNTKQSKPHNYDKISKEGFIPEDSMVEAGDVIIGKCMPQKNGNLINNKDTSVVLKNNEKGFIDRNCYNDNHFTNINGDGYTFAKVRIRSDRIPCIGDKFCLPPSAEVLTSNGWKSIATIEPKDLVVQLDPETMSASFVHPTASYTFDHDGDMYTINGDYVSLSVTMEHKMFVKHYETDVYTLEMANDIINTTNMYCKTASCLKAETTDMPAYATPGIAYVLAATIYKGWIKEEDKTVNIMSISQEDKDKIETILDHLNVRYIIDHANGQKRIAIFDATIYDMVRAALTRLPQWLHCHQDIAREFIHRIFCETDVQCRSAELCDQLQLVALAAGYSADIIITQTSKICHIRLNRKAVATQNHVATVTHYTGTVHCIEVPSHIFYVRMNGKCMWTGNSSRHGQKGTVGMLYRQEDMPFTHEGIVPDIIINPHAIPSRMTIAQLMECIMGKACAGLGTFGDATPFTDLKVEDIAQALEKCGIERYGNELLYNSRTGEQMPTAIFIGPTYYQRLKHMVDDKAHSRSSNGPVVMLTRQPAEGRARDGGLRLGEMEVECNWAHGTMQFLKERFMECSDNYRVFVCKKCGMIANVNPEKAIYNCKSCKNITHFSEIRIPYASKLLFQEIQTMGIAAKFIT